MYISESDKIVIRELIEQQLKAFQQNDEAAAFSLASPRMQKKYEQNNFIAAIESQYNAIVKSRSIIFQRFTLVNNYPALVAMIMDQKGELTQGVFIVQQQADYSWRIHGYELLSVDEKII